jgi:hypothetical protein
MWSAEIALLINIATEMHHNITPALCLPFWHSAAEEHSAALGRVGGIGWLRLNSSNALSSSGRRRI